MKTTIRIFHYSYQCKRKRLFASRSIPAKISSNIRFRSSIHTNLFRFGIISLLFILLSTNCKKDQDISSHVIDFDGNIYKTVQIGSQLWMAENLRVTHYNNGDGIPDIKKRTAEKNNTGFYTDYDCSNESAVYYGHLYDGYVIMDSRGICPEGWHVPTATDWELLISELGGPGSSGVLLGGQGIRQAKEPITERSAVSGFNTVFSGFHDECGLYLGLGQAGYYWSSTINPKNEQGYIYASCQQNETVMQWDSPGNRFSVRLVKD